MIEQKIDHQPRFLNSCYLLLSNYTCNLSKKVQVKMESFQKKQKRSRTFWKIFVNNFLKKTS